MMNLLQNIKEKLSLKKIQESITTKNPGGKELKFKIGATSGLYGIARDEELTDIIGKLSYTLTRGAAAIELASDVPHEIDYTQGWELRRIAEKQGIDITLHGSLTVGMDIPERIEWSIAQDHMQRSIKSAVFGGAKYVDFHACLREWLELFTYAGARLNIVMSDPNGDFIGKLFKDNPKLAHWFVNDERYNFWEMFASAILGPQASLIYQEAMNKKVDEILDYNHDKIIQAIINVLKRTYPNAKEDELARAAEDEFNGIKKSSLEVKQSNIIKYGIMDNIELQKKNH